MNNPWSEFDKILQEHLIPDYREGKFFQAEPAFLKSTKWLFDEADARNFVAGWNAGLIKHDGGGKYSAPRSGPCEKFFNAQSKKIQPRTFTLAQESVISLGIQARLLLEFGWPRGLVGMQSKDSAFDVVTFISATADEHIACEVKSSSADFKKLIREMCEFCISGENEDIDVIPTRKRNSYKKFLALQARKPPIFWAVGPAGLSQVFMTSYEPDGSILLTQTDETALLYPSLAPAC